MEYKKIYFLELCLPFFNYLFGINFSNQKFSGLGSDPFRSKTIPLFMGYQFIGFKYYIGSKGYKAKRTEAIKNNTYIKTQLNIANTIKKKTEKL